MFSGCVAVIMINLSVFNWIAEDYKNMDNAKKTCRIKYGNSSCLKKFIKVEPLIYRAICD